MAFTAPAIAGRDGTLATIADPPLAAAEGITSQLIDPGAGVHLNHVTTATAFDLSNVGAQTEQVLWNPLHRLRLQRVYILYPEATSANAGVTISLGITGDADEFGTLTSAVSQSANTVTDVTSSLLANDTTLEVGEILLVTNAGSKTGTGTFRLCIVYTVDDE